MFLVLSLVDRLADDGIFVNVKRKDIGLLGVFPVFDTKEQAEKSLNGGKAKIIEVKSDAS
jgi:hypothetical protein